MWYKYQGKVKNRKNINYGGKEIMTCNTGKIDRILRVVLGTTLIIIGVVVSGTTGIILGGIGLILLGTGLVGNCPAYTLLKINTCNPPKL